MKDTNAKINLFIVIILVVIIVAAIILFLKISGVIKPSESSNEVEEDYPEVYFEYKTYPTYEDYKREKAIETAFDILKVAISIAISLGTSKLYKKLGLPNYIVIFTFIYPILMVIKGFTYGFLEIVISIVFSMLGIISMYNYFKAVGMSGKWAIMPFIALLIMSFGLSSMLAPSFVRDIGTGGSFITIIASIMLIAWVIAYILSNVKLGQMFGKTTPFIVGLAILPFIFQPILGYSKEDGI